MLEMKRIFPLPAAWVGGWVAFRLWAVIHFILRVKEKIFMILFSSLIFSAYVSIEVFFLDHMFSFLLLVIY